MHCDWKENLANFYIKIKTYSALYFVDKCLKLSLKRRKISLNTIYINNISVEYLQFICIPKIAFKLDASLHFSCEAEVDNFGLLSLWLVNKVVFPFCEILNNYTLTYILEALFITMLCNVPSIKLLVLFSKYHIIYAKYNY